MKAWLITWAGSDKSDKRDGEVASILNPRLGHKAVGEHIERLYSDACYNLSERLDAARTGPRKNIPYPAEFNHRKITINGISAPQLVSITCGHNPHLLARRVTGLEVREDENDVETLYWDHQ